MDNSEQWLSYGNCDICRRKKFCGKPCTANKRADRAQIAGIAAAIMCEAMMRGANDLSKKEKE